MGLNDIYHAPRRRRAADSLHSNRHQDRKGYRVRKAFKAEVVQDEKRVSGRKMLYNLERNLFLSEVEDYRINWMGWDQREARERQTTIEFIFPFNFNIFYV